MNYTFLIYKMTGVPVIVTNDLLVAWLLGMATGWRKAEKILLGLGKSIFSVNSRPKPKT